MRITNSMMANNLLLNINRNMRSLDTLNRQVASGKKIQVPSDNPLIASRALKFRTNISENENFQRNAESGLAWMDVSEAAMGNIVHELLDQLKDRLVEGANGTLTQDDKKNIITDIRNLLSQIGLNMNQTYAERYVFSGCRTDQPALLTDDSTNSYIITQVFNTEDVEKTLSYQKYSNDPTGMPEVNNINIIKLPYKNVDFSYTVQDQKGNQVQVIDSSKPPYGMGIYKPDGTAYTIIPKSLSDTDAYTPPDDNQTIHYIAETGELVMGNTAATEFQNGTTVTYMKDNIKVGELNPLVYFSCIEMSGSKVQQTADPIGATYNSFYALESKEMYDALINYSTGISDNQGFYFEIDGQWARLADFDVGSYMKQYYDDKYASSGAPSFEDFIKNMYDDPYNGDYDVSSANKTIFADVLQGALKMGFDPINNHMSPPLVSANPTVTIDSTTGEIVVDFAFDTGNKAAFQSISCSPADSASFGHGFLHNLFRVTTTTNSKTLTVYTADEMNSYDMEHQYISYEFSTNTAVAVNTLAKDVLTDKMYADLLRLCDFADSLYTSDTKQLEKFYSEPPNSLVGEDLTAAVEKQLNDENALLQSALFDRFNNMLHLLERHAQSVSNEYTSLGSRGRRLELLQARLEQDQGSYTQLLSSNEDIDVTNVLVQKSAAEAAYTAALKVGANVVQMSLANFIG